ncbi:Arc family DNA-binding protein [Acinetobacter sp. YH12069]|uniref:Arc family DNA-binding protein n=1 Tax=Acinetobacter sp. YH12069 TaxID=2601065 RepID=UPI0015D28F41|nr:Arc family DNA-binding protein [Acinetobacter sp. YH12069]
MTTSRDTGTQHKLRMPPELKEKLFHSAKDMNRSLNAEIVARLEESFNETGLVASDPYKRMLLANVAMIVASEADNPNPSFTRAMERITKAIMVDEKYLFDIYKELKNQEK